MPSPVLIAVTLLLVVAAAIPTGRLNRAGLSGSALATYLVTVVLLGLLVWFGIVRILVVPVLAVLYIAPLIVEPALLGRLLRRTAADPAAGARPVGSGTGRTIRPDGTVEPDDRARQ